MLYAKERLGGNMRVWIYAQRLGGSTKCFSNDSEGTSIPRRDRDTQPVGIE